MDAGEHQFLFVIDSHYHDPLTRQHRLRENGLSSRRTGRHFCPDTILTFDQYPYPFLAGICRHLPAQLCGLATVLAVHP